MYIIHYYTHNQKAVYHLLSYTNPPTITTTSTTANFIHKLANLSDVRSITYAICTNPTHHHHHYS